VSDGVKVESAARCRGFAEANMMNKRIGRIGSTAAAVIGGLALTHRVGAVPAVITGNGNIFELSATSSSTYHTTQPGTAPSYPYIQFREYFAPGGGFDERIWMKVNLSSIPAGSAVTNSKLNLAWFSSSYGTYAPHSDNVDLWSVADEFTSGANFLTYDGTNPWTDGPQSGIDGYARTGPAGRHLGSLFKLGGEPAGAPSEIVMNSSYSGTPPPNYNAGLGATLEYKSIYDHDRGNTAKFAMDSLDEYLTKQKLAGKDAYFALTIDNGDAKWMQFIATSDDGTFWPTDTGNPYFANQPKLELEYAPFVPTWHLNDSGDWSAPAGNWYADVVPNGVGQSVVFGSYVTGSVVVNVDAPKTAGHITFASPESYTLAGANVLTMDVTNGSATINVLNGSQVITAPLQLAKNTTFTVTPAASTLSVSDLGATSANVTKAGDGTLIVNHVRSGDLTVSAGTLQVIPDSTSAGVSKIADLSIAAAAKIDLKRNKLITSTPAGTFTAGAYTDVQGEVARAYNFGSWDQPGLTTSEELAGQNAGPLSNTTTIGVATAEQILFIAPTETGTFAGQTVTGAMTIAMYTYAGDLNFDGLVDGADYGVIDNYVQFPGTDGYANGDFNYDGIIDGADYGIIDNTIQLQGPPIPVTGGAGLSGVAAIPEPASLSLIGLGAAASLLRRPRRRRRDRQ
jgi:autotransporter-associated beta strand protein